MADKNTVVVGSPEELGRVDTRRNFLRMLGVGGSIVLLPSLFAACGDNDAPYGPAAGIPGGGNASGAVVLNLSNDVGILNYAYALEQLESAFYTQLLAAPAFAGLAALEREFFTDLRNHEVIHREFFRAAIPAASRIPDLAVNFGTAFADRTSIFTNTVTFEDTGVAAYNGAGKYLRDTANLLLAGKIVSVEARHAAVARDFLRGTPTAFADLTDAALVGIGAENASALDVVREPAQVLTAVDPFVTTAVTIGTQPSPRT